MAGINHEKIYHSRNHYFSSHPRRRRFRPFFPRSAAVRGKVYGWGVQEAGMNWSGDNIRNLETITFTRNDDKTITVDHRVQQGSKEVEGSLSGTGAIDGGRLIVTTKTGREVTFSYSRISKLIELPLKNADKTVVTVKPLTGENIMIWKKYGARS